MDINNYLDRTQILINLGIDKTDIWNYATLPLEQFFNDFFAFTQTDLDNSIDKVGADAVIYFYNYTKNTSAYANKINNIPHIGISHKLMVELKNRFDLMQNDDDPDLTDTIYRSCLLFIYYHEKAHLIQNKAEINWPDNVSEHDQHVNEFDADQYASVMTIIHFKQALEKIDPSRYNINEVIGVLVAGLYWFFCINGSADIKLYLFENRHPHPFSRVIYIINRCYLTVRDNWDKTINEQAITQFFLKYIKRIAEKDDKINLEKLLLNIKAQMPIDEYFGMLLERHREMKKSAITLDSGIEENNNII